MKRDLDLEANYERKNSNAVDCESNGYLWIISFCLHCIQLDYISDTVLGRNLQTSLLKIRKIFLTLGLKNLNFSF